MAKIVSPALKVRMRASATTASRFNPPALQRGHNWRGSQQGGRSWIRAVLDLRRGLRAVIAFSYGAAAAAFGRAQKFRQQPRFDSSTRHQKNFATCEIGHTHDARGGFMM